MPAFGLPIAYYSTSLIFMNSQFPSLSKKSIFLTLLAVSVCFLSGCVGPKLAGTFDGRVYTSPQRDYSVPIPVTTCGGRVVGDDERGVTFRDDMGMRVSFYSMQFEPGSKMMSALQTGGHRGALEQYVNMLYRGIEVRNYHPDIREGTVSFVFLKNGATKTSGAAFIHASRVYLVEFDLPDVTDHLWRGTKQEQTLWLEERALKLAQTIRTK